MPHIGEIPDETNMTQTASPEAGAESKAAEIHLCDNYSHLLIALADLAGRPAAAGSPRPYVLYIDDQLPLDDRLLHSLATLANAEIARVSDRAAVDSFAKFPRFVPAMLRRNLSWTAGRSPLRPSSWTPAFLSERNFETGYVYHPGFFLSKVVAGRCRRVVMRDSGYANYVRHRVPWTRKVPRLLAGRSPTFQTWGEEPWVDEIQVVRPDQLPNHVRHKASRATLDDFMGRLSNERARAVATSFWGDIAPPAARRRPTALILTQPIDHLGICTTSQKSALYAELADRLRQDGLDIVVKHHPRESTPVLPHESSIPAPFPIEAWAWLGQPRFELAVSINSASLAAPEVSFAEQRLQLVPPDRFYPKPQGTCLLFSMKTKIW